MFKKLQYVCVVGSVGFIAADRIDLFFKRGPFTLTPFLVLAPLAVMFSLLHGRLHAGYSLTVSPPIRRQTPFLALVVIFLFLASASTIFGIDPQQGLMSLADLCLITILGYCLSVLILTDPKQEKLVLRCISFSLIVYLIFCIGECIVYSQGVRQWDQQSGWSLQAMFAPTTLFWLPRLSGATFDSNRAAFVLVMYLAVLDSFVGKTRKARFLRIAIVIFVFLTLSRSGMLCLLVYYLFSKGFRKRVFTRKRVAWVAIFVIVCSATVAIYEREISNMLEILELSDMVSDRVSGEEGSSGGDHIRLIQKGIDVWLYSPRTVVSGIGLAAAPKVLGDFFQDQRGNFHCLYVTVLAELGLPAFIVLIILLGYPIIGRKGTDSCIAAIAVFNLPYQSHMEPIFWLAIALMWSCQPRVQELRHLVLDRIPAS